VKRLACLFALLPCLLIASNAAAGPLTGRVVDPSDRAMAGALVVLLAEGRPVRSVFTNERGEFTLDAPDTGALELRIAQQGFRATPLLFHATKDAKDLGTIRVVISAVSEAVVVSAAQVELPLSAAPSTVSVLSSLDLEARQIHSVADALRTVPGMTVASTGGVGAVTGVFPRGGESNFTLVFVDDVPVNAFGGEFDFAHLPTVNVDRIEIVRGPQSALFGSNAMGGVVRVVTRRGGPPSFAATAEAGGYDTYRYTAATSGSRGAFDWGASGERLQSDGFNGRRTAAGFTVENDDYQRTSGMLSAAWRQGTSVVRAQMRHGEDERGAPGPFGQNPIGIYTKIDTISRSWNRHTTASAMGSFPIAQRVRAVVLGAFHRVESDFASPGFGSEAVTRSEALSRRWAGRAQADYSPTQSVAFSAGVEFQRERAGSTYITGETGDPITIDRSVAGYFAEARVTAAQRLFLTGGIRVEDIRQDRIEPSPDLFSPRPERAAENVISINPKVSAAWMVRSQAESFTKVRASAGTGIRPPSGFDLAFTDNPALKPERSSSTEVGIEQAFAGGLARAEAVGFLNNYDDLIVAVGSFAESSHYRTDNISNARSRGLELGISGRARVPWRRPLDLEARFTYTFLDTEILAVDDAADAPPPFRVGQALLRQPAHQFATDVTARVGRFSAFVTGGGRGRALDVEPSFGTFGGLFHTDGFHAWNAGGAWKFRRAEVFGRVENFLDKDYEEALGFPALGRRATVGLRVAAGR
jgi:outer membrane cobalamin receptor